MDGNCIFNQSTSILNIRPKYSCDRIKRWKGTSGNLSLNISQKFREIMPIFQHFHNVFPSFTWSSSTSYPWIVFLFLQWLPELCLFLSPGLLHIRRGGGGGGEGARASSSRHPDQRQTAQVQGPLLQETQVLWRLRSHDSVYVLGIMSRGCARKHPRHCNIFPTKCYVVRSWFVTGPTDVFLFVFQWTTSLLWGVKTARPTSTIRVSHTSSSRDALAKLWVLFLPLSGSGNVIPLLEIKNFYSAV